MTQAQRIRARNAAPAPTVHTYDDGRIQYQLSTGHDGIQRGAALSSCGAYRYALTRTWSTDLPLLVFVMLNPSTADGLVDDNTIRSCVRLAQELGFGGIIVVNLFALRSTDPGGLKLNPDPTGRLNDQFLLDAAEKGSCVVVAWGTHGKVKELLRPRAVSVLHMLRTAPGRAAVWSFGHNNDGQPKHPLYLPTNATLQPYLLQKGDIK